VLQAGWRKKHDIKNHRRAGNVRKAGKHRESVANAVSFISSIGYTAGLACLGSAWVSPFAFT